MIDADRTKKGRFIITGSSSFDLIKNVSESLAGRAAVLELGTLKMNEYYEQPLSPFYQIFSQKINSTSLNYLREIKPLVSYSQVNHFFLKGGYPEPALSKNDLFYANRKLAGILIENTIASGKIEYSVIGIGLNVNQKSFEYPHLLRLRENNQLHILTQAKSN